MPANYVLLEKITVGAAGASSIIFSSIPQTGYTDLKIIASTRGDRSATNAEFFVKFNGATTNFTYRLLQGNASAAGSNNGSTGLAGVSDAATNTANTFANSEIYIPNYTSANYKSYSVDSVEENNTSTTPAIYTYLIAGLWSNTAAITSIELYPEGSTNWTQYSTFYLYGVAKLGTTPAIVPYATGGDTIMTDGTYWYHAFKANGTFTPAKALSCDVLVVAGGGSGSAEIGSGGGAGGIYYATAQSFASGTGYTATVGAGGASRSTASQGDGNNGSNSSFGALTAAVGGGGGGSANSSNGKAGGSGGGGGANQSGGPFTGGAPTSGQGNAGGTGGYSTQGGLNYWTGAGGGGAGGAGGNGGATNFYTGGSGGAGTNTYSSWLSTTGLGVSGYIAGGGGGIGMQQYGGGSNTPVAGPAGSGGGGTGGMANAYGGSSSAATNGTANTGGGGGGASWSQTAAGSAVGTSGQGGSGLVIVRYAV
jgi:hypothetical protein